MPALTMAVVCHELGHITAAFLAGVRVRGLRLRRGGGGLSLHADADSASYMRALAVYAGGCIANIIAAAIFHAHTQFAVLRRRGAVQSPAPRRQRRQHDDVLDAVSRNRRREQSVADKPCRMRRHARGRVGHGGLHGADGTRRGAARHRCFAYRGAVLVTKKQKITDMRRRAPYR